MSTIRSAIVAALLFWISFVSSFPGVMVVQRTAWSRLGPLVKKGELSILRVGLRLPSPDPLVAEFVLVAYGEHLDGGVERVRSSGVVVDAAWTGEPDAPLTWRAVALDRAGCIVYAGTAMMSAHTTAPMDKMDMLLRRLDVPLCARAALQEREKLIDLMEGL